MIPDTCIKIETSKFPPMDGEDDELVNEGMYGKALCLYLKDHLQDHEVQTNRIVCEDWGWWLDVEGKGVKMGLCVYCEPAFDDIPKAYAILPSKPRGRFWLWRKFRFIDKSESIKALMDTVSIVLEADPEIGKVSKHNDYMF